MKDPFAPLHTGPHSEPRTVDMSTVRSLSQAIPVTFPADGNPLVDEDLERLGVTFAGQSVRCTCPCECKRATLLTRDNLRSSRLARLAAPTARCTDCKAPGHHDTTDEEDAALVAQSFAEAAAARHERALAAWRERVPNKFREAPGGDDEFLLDRVERFKQGVPSGFIVSGSYGTGKTWMAFGFLNLLVALGLVHPSEILFGRENELLGVISMGTFAEQEEARRRLGDPKYKIVYIDDAGQGNFRSARDAHSIWNQFMDSIWSTDRVVIVTTNYSLAAPAIPTGAERQASQFEQWIGGAAYDRLGGASGYAVQVMGAGDDSNHRRLNSMKVEQQWRAEAAERGSKVTAAADAADTLV